MATTVFEVIIQAKTTGLIHTDIVQGSADNVKKWAEKEAAAYGAVVSQIKPVKMPETLKERSQMIII